MLWKALLTSWDVVTQDRGATGGAGGVRGPDLHASMRHGCPYVSTRVLSTDRAVGTLPMVGHLTDRPSVMGPAAPFEPYQRCLASQQ